RVGTGYAVAEQNRAGGSGLLLRNSDQHAWPELYVAGMRSPPPPELIAMHAFLAARAEDDLAGLREDELQVALTAVVNAAIERYWLPASAERDARLRALGAGAGTADDLVLGLPDLDRRVLEEMQAIADAIERPLDELLAASLARAEALPQPDQPDAGWVVMDVAPENVLGTPGQPPDPELQRLLAE